MLYLVKMPSWLQAFFPKYIWKKSGAEKKIYLTFDDGPHPIHTIFVLNELRKIKAKATFFCIGKNVDLYPEIYAQILLEGHTVGNHTQNHLRGRNTKNDEYIANIKTASTKIKSNLFRPPYGSIKNSQAKILLAQKPNFEIIMWTVLSGDFDQNITKEKCLQNVVSNAENGSIVLFHDSDKAAERMQYALPIFLKTFYDKGFVFEKL